MTINLGGELRPVKYTVNALIELEEITKIDFTDKASRSAFGKLKNVRALAFVGLKHGWRSESTEAFPFSLEQVGDWLTPEAFGQIQEAFSKDNGSGEESSEVGKEKKLNGVTSEELPVGS